MTIIEKIQKKQAQVDKANEKLLGLRAELEELQSQIAELAGIKLHRNNGNVITLEQVDHIKELLLLGNTYRYIADKVGVSIGSITKYSRRNLKQALVPIND